MMNIIEIVFVILSASFVGLAYLHFYTLSLAVGAIVVIASFVAYFVPWLLYSYVLQPQNLKKKYQTEWALVTGGSSGIGRAVCSRLAAQGVNVVIAAFPDNMLGETAANLTKKYKVQVRTCEVNLGENLDDAMKKITACTNDLDIGIVFSNAGYILTGLFAQSQFQRQQSNLNCNAVIGVHIAHHFLARWRDSKRKRAALIFTSSPAAFMACPFSVLYGATKAFITEFAVSLAAEVKSDGIDVCVVHPSPVNTQFYTNAGKLSALAAFRKTAVTPEVIADAAFRTVGRFVVCDQGWYSWSIRVLLKLVDTNVITEAGARFLHTMKDFKAMKKE